MVKLREQLEQILDEQDKLKAEFEKQKAEYIQNSGLISLRRQKLIVNEINKFIDLYCIKEEDGRYDLNEFCILFAKYVEYDIHDIAEILRSIGYIKYERATIGNLAWAKPYIKGFKPK